MASIADTQNVIEAVLTDKKRCEYINNDGIDFDLDGASMAKWLRSCGYTVVGHIDTGSRGLVTLSNGIEVSTNGCVTYCGD